MSRVLAASIAPSTLSTYNSGNRAFIHFCRQMGIYAPFPPTEELLVYFAVSLRYRVSVKTIKVYLTAIQYFSNIRGGTISLPGMNRLYYALRGIKRLQGNSFSRATRAPFTLPMIKNFLHKAAPHLSYRDYTMIKAASLLAFFGLLRASEYLSSKKWTYDAEGTLLFSDICFAKDNSHISIYIKKSKTDPFRQGCTIKVWATYDYLCPVHTLHTYFSFFDQPNGPLFQFSNGSLLTRNSFSDLIKQYSSQTNLNTHSFRIGGASAAHAGGIPDSTIQALGRWASNAFRIYLRLPDTTIQQAQRKMHSTFSIATWSPPEEQGEAV